MACLFRVQAKIQQGQLAEALEDVDKAIALNPEGCDLDYYLRAELNSNLGRQDAAISDFSQAISLHGPHLMEAYFSRGILYLFQGLRAEALSDLDHALHAYPEWIEKIRLNPKYTEAVFERAKQRFLANQHAEALQDFNRVIQCQPKHSYAYLLRGVTKMAMRGFSAGVPDVWMAARLYIQSKLRRT
jgi:tetratricopeptide (TPR) repeat protein